MHIPSHISWPIPRCRPSITIFTPFFSPSGTSTVPAGLDQVYGVNKMDPQRTINNQVDGGLMIQLNLW
jgi:hypothetical protein